MFPIDQNFHICLGDIKQERLLRISNNIFIVIIIITFVLNYHSSRSDIYSSQLKHGKTFWTISWCQIFFENCRKAGIKSFLKQCVLK